MEYTNGRRDISCGNLIECKHSRIFTIDKKGKKRIGRGKRFLALLVVMMPIILVHKNTQTYIHTYRIVWYS
jgi:hypothetical protein